MVSGQLRRLFMVTSWYGNAFRITGPLSGGSTGRYSSQRVSGAEIIFVLPMMRRYYHILVAWRSCRTTVELLVIWDAMMPMSRHCNVVNLLRFQHYLNKTIYVMKNCSTTKILICVYICILHLLVLTTSSIKFNFEHPDFRSTWNVLGQYVHLDKGRHNTSDR